MCSPKVYTLDNLKVPIVPQMTTNVNITNEQMLARLLLVIGRPDMRTILKCEPMLDANDSQLGRAPQMRMILKWEWMTDENWVQMGTGGTRSDSHLHQILK